MAEETKDKVEVTVDQIKADLKNGVTRDQMKEKYGLKRADIMRIFKHPELKGLKVHTAGQKKTRRRSEAAFILKDSAGNDVTNVVFPTTSATPAVEGVKANVPASQSGTVTPTPEAHKEVAHTPHNKPLAPETSKW